MRVIFTSIALPNKTLHAVALRHAARERWRSVESGQK